LTLSGIAIAGGMEIENLSMVTAMRPAKFVKSFKGQYLIVQERKVEKTKGTAKKICMVAYTNYLHDARVSREARSLVKNGYRVDCLCLRSKGQLKHENIKGVNLYRLPLSKYRGSSKAMYLLAYLWFFVLSFFEVTTLYYKRRYHVIQYHTLPDFIIFSGIIPKLFGAKLVLDMHEVTPEFYMSKFGFKTSHPLVKILMLLEKMSVRFAHAVIVINDPIKRLLGRCKSRSDMVVVMNTADESIFASDHHTRSSGNNCFIAMYHGTLTNLYGVDVAIRATAKLKDKIPNLQFRIFGSETETNHLKKLANELGISGNVAFMGRVKMEAIPKYIEQADIGIVPIVKDEYIDLSFSNKLAEYVSMKTPAVATRLRSTSEYFTDDAISFFESRNEDSLASKILKLYMNPHRRFLQAERAFRQYQAIRWPVMEKRYIALIESLVNS
jgi:glycosyltransferase involved in cell wall biosynthesis